MICQEAASPGRTLLVVVGCGLVRVNRRTTSQKGELVTDTKLANSGERMDWVEPVVESLDVRATEAS